jgi:OOP family OmpA-OmpF porin
MKKILTTLIATSAALSGVAYAQSAYVGASVVAGQYEYNVPNAVSGDNKSGTKAAGKVFAGYNFDKTWAVEAGYTDYGSQSYSYLSRGGSGSIHTDSTAFYVAGKATMPINDRVSVYGKLGAIENRDKIRGVGNASGLRNVIRTNLYAAVGAEYAINTKVSLLAEYEHNGKSANQGRESGAVSLGARYSF